MTIKMKRGDRLPSLRASLRRVDPLDGVSKPISVTGLTVKMLVKDLSTGSVLINAAASFLDPPEGDDDHNVQYDWGVNDTANAGTWKLEFETTDGSGRKETFPNGGYHTLVVVEDLG